VYGCAALELCYIASGIFDAFIDMRNMLRVTDIAHPNDSGGGWRSCYRLERKSAHTALDVKLRGEHDSSNGRAHDKLLELA